MKMSLQFTVEGRVEQKWCELTLEAVTTTNSYFFSW